MAPAETASSIAEAESRPIPSEPAEAQVTSILAKPQWAQARVFVENMGADVSESDAAVIVSGPRPSIETFLQRAYQVTALVQVFPPPPDTAALRKRFNALARRWRKESRHVSSITQLAMHPAYQQIIGLGRPAVPLILQRLEQEPDQWFWALRAITGANPVRQEHLGRVEDMADDWIRWARKNGFLI